MQNQQDPTDWENCYAQGNTPWEKGSPAPPLLEFLETNTLPDRILVPGCGFGHEVRALAAANPLADVVGLDISHSAIAAAENHLRAGNERYVLANLFDLPQPLLGAFDMVFEHTCLSALPPALRPQYVAGFHSALKPNGTVLAIFFLHPWDDGETPSPPPYSVSTEELDAMFGDHFTLIREWLPNNHHPGREGRELMRLLQRID